MGFAHIENLYKDKTILMFKECYAMEKIHGTSTHITWNVEEQKISFFSNGEKHEDFVALFDVDNLKSELSKRFTTHDVKIFGEAYGGKMQGMSKTYGDKLKFIAFDVRVANLWLNVPSAEKVCLSLGLEFVDYEKVSTDLASLDAQRDKDSTQAIRNGCGPGKIREGVVLRTLIEVRTNNGSRIIAKHKRPEFSETKTPREVNFEALKVIEDAREAADEWVTEMRLNHVLDKLPKDLTIRDMKTIISAMVEDVYREGRGEVIESRELTTAIGKKTALLFKEKVEFEKRK